MYKLDYQEYFGWDISLVTNKYQSKKQKLDRSLVFVVVFAAGCQENHQAFLMEMLDNLSEYTQSKTHVIRMIDNEPENQHRETDVDRNLCP